ncbi:MAG: hypothetical protein IKR09_09600, partial [Alphaproteobacteria bacterium]|nr:hypothetical protein [Alphaproteobacteria bacterium]
MDRYSMLPSRKDGNFDEHYRALDWIVLGFIYSALAAFLFSLIAYPLGHMISHGFSAQSWGNVKNYFSYLKTHPHYYFIGYFRWIMQFASDPFQSFAIWIPAMPIFIFIGGCLMTIKTNPYYFVQLNEGDGRFADERDLKSMGVWDGMSFVLGLWEDRRMLRMNNYMSLFVVGAPECGKTSGVVVPSILANDDKCMFINDMKGELFK